MLKFLSLIMMQLFLVIGKLNTAMKTLGLLHADGLDLPYFMKADCTLADQKAFLRLYGAVKLATFLILIQVSYWMTQP